MCYYNSCHGDAVEDFLALCNTSYDCSCLRIELRGRVVNTAAKYSGGPGLSSGPETGYSEFFVVLLSPPRIILGLCLKIRPGSVPS
jgi:hypothetical protein